MSEALTLVATPPTSATTAVAMMTRATISSTSVSPRSSCVDTRRVISDVDLVEDAVHGRDHGDGHEADHAAHEDDHGRLEERGQLLQLVVQLALVVVRGHVQLGIERARLLAYPDHAGRRCREELARRQRAGQPLTAHHRLTDVAEGADEDPVAQRLGS